jgi:hypothetical protein
METFLLRVWHSSDRDKSPPPGLHGVVLHVGTGWERPFRSCDELVDLLRAWESSPARASRDLELRRER